MSTTPDLQLSPDLAERSGAQLSAVNGEAIHAATESAARAQALLVAFHDDMRAALLFLMRNEAGAAERFPAPCARVSRAG